jgi:hypothetical protein
VLHAVRAIVARERKCVTVRAVELTHASFAASAFPASRKLRQSSGHVQKRGQLHARASRHSCDDSRTALKACNISTTDQK